MSKSTKETTQSEECDACEDLKESLARAQADYANYRRRTEQEAEKLRKTAAKAVLSDILDTVDNMQLALRQAPDKKDSLYAGMEMIMAQLISTLEEHGLERIPDDAFDPALHEAILSEESDEPKGTILEVLQQGYMLEGQPLRTAKVKVSKGKEKKNE